MKNLATQAFSQCYTLGRISPEYADGTLTRYVCKALHVILQKSHNHARYIAGVSTKS